MRQDVIDLRDFYATRLGQVARRMIRCQVRALWPDTAGMRVLGIGYPTPYLRPVRDGAERVMAVMPASQGVLHWPAAEPGQVCLAEEEELPFEDATFDRIIMVHALETSEQVRGLLREAWRVMAGNGRLLTVVPNRRGIWARLERTPFGHGHPYSPPQLNRLLRECMFTPIQSKAALYIPPSRRRAVLSAAPAVENIGARWLPALAGVLVAEAGKQIYGIGAKPARRRRPVLVPLPTGSAAHARGSSGQP
jgi:SAM-dependent methyltransferase